jgi:hypothetical protein
VHVGHADEAAGLQRGLAARPFADPRDALEQGVSEIVLVAVGEQLDVADIEGLLALDPDLQE